MWIESSLSDAFNVEDSNPGCLETREALQDLSLPYVINPALYPLDILTFFWVFKTIRLLPTSGSLRVLFSLPEVCPQLLSPSFGNPYSQFMYQTAHQALHALSHSTHLPHLHFHEMGTFIVCVSSPWDYGSGRQGLDLLCFPAHVNP